MAAVEGNKKVDRDIMVRLYKEYGLTADHIHTHRHYTIISRQGIDMIMAKAKVNIMYEEVLMDAANKYFIVKATGTFNGKTIQTYGEAAPENTSQKYFMAMAEKRAMSRCVLKLVGLYEEGVFSEEEADDFKRTKAAPTQAAAPKKAPGSSTIDDLLKSTIKK